jgi:hypothetical protein
MRFLGTGSNPQNPKRTQWFKIKSSMMETFLFDEYQWTTISLPILAQALNFGKREKSKRKKGLVGLTFFTETPTAHQLKTLDFIRENQRELVEAIYHYTKEVLYPTHIQFVGYDKIQFPAIQKSQDLKKTLGINTIYIVPESQDDSGSFQIRFNFSGYSHGVGLFFHQTQILGWVE